MLLYIFYMVFLYCTLSTNFIINKKIKIKISEALNGLHIALPNSTTLTSECHISRRWQLKNTCREISSQICRK